MKLSPDFSLLPELHAHEFEMSAHDRISWQSRRVPVVLSNKLIAHRLLEGLPLPTLKPCEGRCMLKTATNATITMGKGLEIIEGSGKFKVPFVGEVKMHVAFGELCNARVFAVPPGTKYVDVNLRTMECLGSRNVYLKVCDFLLPLLEKHKPELERIAKTLQAKLGADWFRADVFFDDFNVTVNDLEYPSTIRFEGDPDDSACIDTLLNKYKRRDFALSSPTLHTLVDVEAGLAALRPTHPNLPTYLAPSKKERPLYVLPFFLLAALVWRRRRSTKSNLM